MSDVKRERMNEAAARANAAAEGVALGVGAGALTLGALMTREGAEAARIAEQQRQEAASTHTISDGLQQSGPVEAANPPQPAESAQSASSAGVDPSSAHAADAVAPLPSQAIVTPDASGTAPASAAEPITNATGSAADPVAASTPVAGGAVASTMSDSASLTDRANDLTPAALDQAMAGLDQTMQSLHATTDALGTAIQSSVASTLQSVTSALDGVTGDLARATDGLGQTITNLTAGALAPVTDMVTTALPPAGAVIQTIAATPDLATDLFEGLSGDFARTIELGFIGQPLGAGDAPHDLPMSTLHDLHHGLI